jgi:hypothetical protein
VRLCKRQSWTVTRQLNTGRPSSTGRVTITTSDGEVREVLPGETVNIDATLELTPLEQGWEVLP